MFLTTAESSCLYSVQIAQAKVVNEWVKRRVFATETALLGLDAEWDNSFQRQDYLSKVNKDTRAMLLPVDVIQLATESSVLVYHMSACEDLKQQYRKWKDTQDSFSDSTPSLSGVGPVELPIHLHKLFSSHEYHFVGVGIGQDCAKLKQIGVRTRLVTKAYLMVSIILLLLFVPRSMICCVKILRKMSFHLEHPRTVFILRD